MILLWILGFTISPVYPFQITMKGESDVLIECSDAISSVLKNSMTPGITGTSLVLVSDGKIPSVSISKVFGKLGSLTTIGVFEIFQKDLEMENKLQSLNDIDKISKSSRSMTMVIASDDLEFLEDVIEEFLTNDLLLWPTKLMVVTRLSLQRFRLLRESLSNTNAMVLLLQGTEEEKRFGLYLFFPYSHRTVHVASWTQRFGIKYHTKYQLFHDKFRRLGDGADLAVVGNNFPPHVTIRKVSANNGGKEEFQFSGPMLHLLNMLSKNINFTYSLTQPSDGSWGYLYPNGTWNGMIGMILRKEVAFALGPFGITYIRSRVIDYTDPLVVDYGRILGRRGDTEIDSWGFLLPLTSSVWIATLAILVFVIFIALGASRIGQDMPITFSTISIVTYIRAFLKQDIVVAQDARWERFLLGSWLLGVLILVECYCTNLITLLAVRHVEEPYQTVRSLLDDPGVTMIWLDNSAHTQYLAAVESGIFHEVAEAGKQGKTKYIPAPQYQTIVNELVSQGDYVVITPFLIMKIFLTEDYLDKKGSCKFYVGKERFLPLTFCMVVPKHSPLRGSVNRGIRAVVEGGLYKYWVDKSIANEKSCKNPPTKITVKASLSLANLWVKYSLKKCLLTFNKIVGVNNT